MRLAVLVLLGAAATSTVFTQASPQSSLDQAAVALRSYQALVALDRYLETWNSRNPALWAASLHYPHVRRTASR